MYDFILRYEARVNDLGVSSLYYSTTNCVTPQYERILHASRIGHGAITSCYTRCGYYSAMFRDLSPVLFSFQGVLLLIVFVLTLYITLNLFCDVYVPDLEKKAVLITGCDSGFGYELAKKLDALGLCVFAACLTTEGEAKLSKECSPELRAFKLDVTEDSDVQKALEVVKSDLPSQGTVIIIIKRSVQNTDHADCADRVDWVLYFLLANCFCIYF